MNLELKPHFLRRPILKGKVNFPLCLAPMVGLTHMSFRTLARTYLPQGAVTIWPTEMLNSNRLPNEDLKRTPEAFRGPQETEMVPQILGNREEQIAQSLQILKNWGAEGIDINMGCPVQKALRHNYGVALMGDPQYAAEVVAVTVKNTDLPVSVKFRAVGASQKSDSLEALFRFTEGIEKAGASWVTLHPRTPEQKRRGSADWTMISELKTRTSLPVIGNGDIQTYEDVLRMLDETGCDQVMAGRALAAKPWMLWQVGEKLGFPAPMGKEGLMAPQTAEEEALEYGRCLLELWESLAAHHHLDLAFRKFRFHVRTTAVWLDFGHQVYSLSTKAKASEELKSRIAEFFVPSAGLRMVPRTDLRE